MNYREIKQAIADGKKVFYKNNNYRVIKDAVGQYLIKYLGNGHCIGLVWADDTTLNGNEGDFYAVR